MEPCRTLQTVGTGIHTDSAATARTSQILDMDDKVASGVGDQATSSRVPTGKRKKTTTLGKRDKRERDTTSSLEANRKTRERGTRQAGSCNIWPST